jgi:hypothetical protein
LSAVSNPAATGSETAIVLPKAPSFWSSASASAWT